MTAVQSRCTAHASRPPKILIVDRTTTAIGGVKTYVENLRALLAGMGCDVTVYSLATASFLDRYIIGGIRYVVNRLYRPYGVVLDARLFSWLERFLTRGVYDLVIYQSLAIHSRRCKSVSIVHALWTENCQGSELSQSAIQRVVDFERQLLIEGEGRNFTVSDAYGRHVTDLHAIQQPLPVIENFLVEEFPVRHWAGRSNHVVYTGQFNARKNLPYLVELFDNLRKRESIPGLHLLLIGSGPEESALRELVRERHLDEDVTFVSNPPRHEIKERLARAKVFVLPSTKESFSYSLLEAKLSGCITFALEGLQVPDGFVDVTMPASPAPRTVDVIASIMRAEEFPQQFANAAFSDPSSIAAEKFSRLITTTNRAGAPAAALGK
jgi:glycosyltransferase involved in cell wall biosynthesis